MNKKPSPAVIKAVRDFSYCLFYVLKIKNCKPAPFVKGGVTEISDETTFS